jgi:hypothetical protein
MKRRRLLAVAGLGMTGVLGGCLGSFETTYSRAPPVLENRPDAVYVPTHREGMTMVGRGTAGDLAVALTYSYPHRFWVVERQDGAFVTRLVDIEEDDAIHLMATVWDPRTGLVVPDAGLSLEITREDRLVSQEVIYPMLSQRMGFHYGANFPLSGDGTYEVTVSVGGVNVPRYGAFAGRFERAAETTIPFEYSERERNDLEYTVFEDRQGERAALEPMQMEVVPVGVAPRTLPGETLGTAATGDAKLVGSLVRDERFGAAPYLAVVAHTPYNRLVVPGMALSATVSRNGETVFDGRLPGALDDALGFHYGASVPDVRAGDTVRVTVDVPPQVARHEGYETAFLEMPPVTLSR